MQLSEAINQLQAIIEEHGDIELEIAMSYPSPEKICTDTSNELEIKVVDYGEDYGKLCRIEDVG